MEDNTILSIQDLRKSFAKTRALDNVSLDIRRGSICGFLGPNGAGKTTLLRIINGLLVCDSGSVTINGEPASLSTSRYLGYMPEERGLYDKMRISDQIMYFGRLKGGDPKRLRVVMGELLERFGLNGMEKRKLKELSKGNQQKVQIISTLVHEPEIVILDEPFSGFDPINGAILQDLINSLHQNGTTIILSSHNMPAIEQMCTDIALINKGKILLNGDIREIKEQFKTDAILLTTRRELNEPLLLSSGLLKDITPVSPINGRMGYAYRIHKNPGVSNSQLLDALTLQAEILHFEEELPSLNEIFVKSVQNANA